MGLPGQITSNYSVVRTQSLNINMYAKYRQDTQTMKLKKWVMVKHFEGFPKDSDFELVEEDIPELQDGDVLFQATHLSVDPYMRPYMAHFPEGTTMIGQQLGKVLPQRMISFPLERCALRQEAGSHIIYT